MHARLFDVLHDRAHDYLLAVADQIHVDLDRRIQEVVQQHRTLIADFHGSAHVAAQLLFVVDDLHGTPTQNIGRTNDDGIRDLLGSRDAFLDAAYDAVRRLFQAQLAYQLLKTLAVFSKIDRIGRGTDDRHSGRFEARGEIERRLATKLHDHAMRPLQRDNLHHILEGHWLEEQAVGNVVVGGNCLGVAVDHDGLVPVFAHCESSVHTAVVKLDALANAVWPTAQHHDLLAVGGQRFAFFFIGGVHVRRGGSELCRTGIHALVDRTHVQGVPMALHTELRHFQQRGEARIREPLLLDAEHRVLVEVLQCQRSDARFFLNDVFDLHQEPGIDARQFCHRLDGPALAERIADVPDALATGIHQLALENVHGIAQTSVQNRIETRHAHFQSAQRFLDGLLERAANGHHFADRLHLRGDAVIGFREFLKGEAGNLGDDIVNRWFEGSRCRTPGNFVAQLVERVAHCKLGGNAGDREACRFGSKRRGS